MLAAGLGWVGLVLGVRAAVQVWKARRGEEEGE
jgi:hypothetical protein